MPDQLTKTQQDIVTECDSIKELLITKNKKYGDSVLNPVRLFSKGNASEQILVRLDDKISRLARGSGEENEDVVLDLIGYLVLLRVARSREPKG